MENKPQYIIVHHTGGMNDTFESVKAYHISKGWGNIGYHVFIERNGTMRYGREDNEVGTHCIADGMNFKSIGICLSGNFEIEQPTQKQLDTLEEEIAFYRNEFNIPEQNILGHGKVKGANTLCPGKNLQVQIDNRKKKLLINLYTKVVELLMQLLKK